MSEATAGDADGPTTEAVLSTGHEVTLPLTTEATMTGAILSADYDRARELLPDPLKPIRATRSRAAVSLLCVDYDRIGDGQIEPYDEFSVTIPAVRQSQSTTPYLSVFTDGLSGYVWYLPVTTEPARALGVDVWGYPKVVADIDHDDTGGSRRTTVRADDQHLITVEIKRPRTISQSDTSYNYTIRDGTLLRETIGLDGQVGLWPYSGRVSYELGDHPRARRLAKLDLGSRALLRFYADGEITFGEGDPVAEGVTAPLSPE